MQIAETLPDLSIRPLQVSTGEGPAEFMRERTSLMYDMTPIHSRRNTGVYKTKNWYFDRFMFVNAKNEASIIRRSKAQAEAGAGLVFLHRYFDGEIRGVMGDLSIDRDPGEMYLMDQERRVDCIQFPNRVQGVFLPKKLIGYDPDRHASFIRFSDNRAQGILLYRAFDRAFRNVSMRDSVDPEALNQLLACLKTSLGADRRDGDIRRQARDAMADMIRAYVDRNLTQLNLSASTVLRNFGLSRASLYRMFEGDDGFRRFVNRRRVHRAVMDIAKSPMTRGTISEAAERWGLEPGANFNRAVKGQFGVAPRSLINFPKPELDFTYAASGLDAHTLRIQDRHA